MLNMRVVEIGVEEWRDGVVRKDVKWLMIKI